jgi:heme O synthase-like polyprenyltransferase
MQFPHFLAIALMYREDYERAGFRMLPSFDADSRFTRAEIVGFTVVLVLTTLLPLAAGASALYLLAVSLAGAFFLYYGAKVAGSAQASVHRDRRIMDGYLSHICRTQFHYSQS